MPVTTCFASILGLCGWAGTKNTPLGQDPFVLQGGPLGVVLQKVPLVSGMVHDNVFNSKLTKSGCTIKLLADGLTICCSTAHAPVLQCYCEGGMYVLHAHLKPLSSTHTASRLDSDASSESDDAAEDGCALAASVHAPLLLEHIGLRHLNVAQVKQLPKGDVVTGLTLTDAEAQLQQCTTYFVAKQTRASFPPSTSTSSQPRELIHMNTIDPFRQHSFGGSQYAIVHDETSSYSAVLCVAGKDQNAD
jgi:hypothetical protein